MSGTFTALDSSLSVTNSQKFLAAYNLISRGRWNTIQFLVQTNASTGKRMCLQSTILSGFVDSIRPQQ
jgi:hypothetical protein